MVSKFVSFCNLKFFFCYSKAPPITIKRTNFMYTYIYMYIYMIIDYVFVRASVCVYVVMYVYVYIMKKF